MHNIAGPVAGGVIGGVVFLLAIILGFWWYRRRERRLIENGITPFQTSRNRRLLDEGDTPIEKVGVDTDRGFTPSSLALDCAVLKRAA